MSAHSDSGQARPLRRRIGLLGATISGTGVIVGAGIYALIGEAARYAGGATWLAFAGAATAAALTGVSYARMAGRISRNSPEYQYARAGLGERWGFLAGWLMAWADLLTTAAVALGFGGYAEALFQTPRVLPSLALVAVLCILVWWGIHETILLVNLLTFVELGGLLLVVLLGLPHWGEQPLLELPHGVGGLGVAMALVFFAFIGFDELGNLAEEMHEPRRDLPRAILLAVGISTSIYILVAVSAMSLVGWQTLAGSPAPLAASLSGVLGPRGAAAFDVIAMAATANTVLLLMVSSSRSLYGMARSGALPRLWGAVGVRQTPHLAILTVLVLVSLLIPLGDIALVAQMTNVAVLASFTLVNVSAARLFAVDPKPGPQAVFSQLQPVLGAVSCLALAALSGSVAIGLGMGLGIFGLGLFQIRLRARSRAAVSR